MIAFQHGRADWVGVQPVTGPTFNWDTIEWVVLHYTAALDLIDGDLDEFVDNLPAYLRSIHRDYLNRKPSGYSIGYNAAVDWLGGTWELRGDTFKCAANANPGKPGDENAKTFAILMLVDGQDGATPLAAAAVRSLVAQIRAVRPNVIVLGHRDVDATQCPGTGVYAQIQADVFEPNVEPPPTPTSTPEPPGDDEMVDADDINGVWIAPPPDQVGQGSKNLVWLNAVIAKVGSVADVQRRNGLKVTGVYDVAARGAYDKELARMKAAAGA